jgi:transcriptional regulator with XRE-family HTH domain
MISIIFKTPSEMVLQLAVKAKDKRLSLNLSQKTLSERSGVSYGVLKKFERTGQISLGSLLKIALSLNALKEFDVLFDPKKPEEVASLDELIHEKHRKRGRR